MNDPNSRNNEINQLVADNNINRAIGRLLDFIRDFSSNSDLLSEALILSANYKKLRNEERQNLIDYNTANQARNRIINHILSICKEICVEFYGKKEYEICEMSNEEKNIDHQDKQRNELLYSKLFDAKDKLYKKKDNIICKLTGIEKEYKKSGFKLQNINLTIKPNEIIGVAGENGNGKTTLFRIMSGELKHDNGEILFPFIGENKKTNLNWTKVKHHIAYVQQEIPEWYGSLTENLHYESSIHGIRGRENEEDVEFILHRLGLVEYRDRKWKELSGGFKLRFAIAKALVWKPSLIILDEPLANLDIHTQLLLLNDIRDIANSSKYPVSVIISSQHLHEIEYLADKILFLKEGRSIFYGLKENLGVDRSNNFFELQSNLSKEELNDILEPLQIDEIIHNGLYFQIIVPRNISSEDILKFLISQNVKIKYFRDVSISVKKFFI